MAILLLASFRQKVNFSKKKNIILYYIYIYIDICEHEVSFGVSFARDREKIENKYCHISSLHCCGDNLHFACLLAEMCCGI
jgi:hypothetical protein